MTTLDAPKNKQQQRAERSTNALLEAAVDLIVEGGVDALTFAAIGERAGYSRGLVTARFGNKEGLIDALIDRLVTTWSHRNVAPRTWGRCGLDGALVLIDAIATQAARDPRGLRALYSLMFAATGADERLRRRFATFHAGLRADIAEYVHHGQGDGSVRREIAAAREAELLVASLRGIGYQWLIDPDGFDPVTAFGYLRTTTRHRLATPVHSADDDLPRDEDGHDGPQ